MKLEVGKTYHRPGQIRPFTILAKEEPWFIGYCHGNEDNLPEAFRWHQSTDTSGVEEYVPPRTITRYIGVYGDGFGVGSNTLPLRTYGDKLRAVLKITYTEDPNGGGTATVKVLP